MQLSMVLFCIRIINGNRKPLLLATVVATPLVGGIVGGPQSDGEALSCAWFPSRSSPLSGSARLP